MKNFRNVFVVFVSLIVSIFTLFPSNAFAEQVFSSAVNYAVGTGPYSITSGDFNGDAYLDLAVANASSNNVSILLGVGNGTFGSAVNYAAGTRPHFITSGDFNGDTYLDLALVNQGSNNVSILLGAGNGTFGSAVNYAIGTSPQSVTSGDFNKDTHLDLAVVNQGSNNVSILLGVGNGTFDSAVNYTVGSNPWSITSGDFNGDTYLDLAVVNSNNISVLTGVGNGTFDSAVNYTVGSNPWSITSGDFNGDTYLDLAVANWSSNNVSILLGVGNGTFGSAVNYAAGSYPYSITSGDFNGDTYLDLAVANNDNNVSVLLGVGNGTFGSAINYTVGRNPYFITSGDFNGDTYLDLATANVNGGNISILINIKLTVPSQITDLSASPTPVSVTLSWSEPDDGNSPITGYKIERESPVDGGFTTIVEDTGSTDTSYTDQGLEQGTEYNYKISAINAIGTGTASNEASATTGTTIFPFAGGTGTEQNPFQISTCQQLQDMNYTSDEGTTYPYLSSNYYFILNNNIDCSATRNWNDGAGFMPIGKTYNYNEGGVIYYGAPFIGVFDGNDHTISNLYINRPDFFGVGLFGEIGSSEEQGATIKDLYILNADITILNSGGILVGLTNYASIINCHTSGKITAVTEIPLEGGSGGVAGTVSHSEIFNSSSSARVEDIMAGGIVGASILSDFENLYATGDVTSSFVSGGLVGYSMGGSIYNSYATGDVTGAISGGLVSFTMMPQIFNSYSVGDLVSVNSPFISSMFGTELLHITGGLIGGFIYFEPGELISNYIHNSGWYKSDANNELSGVGAFGYEGEGFITEGFNAEVDYPEIDNTVFYSKSHGVYDQGGENAWEFTGDPWYEQSDNYPKFTEQEQDEPEKPTPSHHHIRSSGSSPSVIASFQLEQQQRAINAGLDPNLYQTGTSTSSLNQEQSPLSFSRILKLTTPRMQGDDVKSLQIYLNTHGYDCGTPDGTFGTKTKQAVIAFQLANGLEGDGIVGLMTQALIK